MFLVALSRVSEFNADSRFKQIELSSCPEFDLNRSRTCKTSEDVPREGSVFLDEVSC